MPGITGLITRMPRERAVALLSKMIAALGHESFYETGTWIDESLGVYVGWCVRKGSFCDGMPICNERGDVTLILSGEEYSDNGTAGGSKDNGHSRNACRASYLVRRYEQEADC